MQRTAEALYDFYKATGKSAEALKYLETSGGLKEQLFNKELTEQLTTMELNYAFEKERDSLEFQKQKELFSVHVELDRQRLLPGHQEDFYFPGLCKRPLVWIDHSEKEHKRDKEPFHSSSGIVDALFHKTGFC